MNQKQIGIIVLIIGMMMLASLFLAKSKEDFYIRQIMSDTGSCFLTDGTCLHADRDFTFYILGAVVSTSLIMLGVYLIFFDKTQARLAEQNVMVSTALLSARKQEKEKDEFNAFLSVFTDDEKKVLKAIRDEEGIQQSTLRFRLAMSKTTLSLLVKSLEERGIVNKKPEGKTNKLFLVKKF